MSTGEKAVNAHVWSTPTGGDVKVFDRWSWRAWLGVRFWEHGFDRPVGEGLLVTAYALDSQGAPQTSVFSVRARPNPEGVYVFHTLPRAGGAAGPPGAGAGAVAVEVRDPRGRFLPVVYVTDDPLNDSSLFLTAGSAIDPGAEEPRFYLFSSPARRVSPRAAAVVRAQLWDRTAARPAAYAVLEVSWDEQVWYGLADERGSALVAFPYPPAPPSPGGAAPRGLYEQRWELEARVRYQGGGDPLPALPGFGLPELGAIAGQPYAGIVPTEEGSPTDSITFSLAYGRETTLRTGGESVLWV